LCVCVCMCMCVRAYVCINLSWCTAQVAALTDEHSIPPLYAAFPFCLPSVYPLHAFSLPSICLLSAFCLPFVLLFAFCRPSIYPLSALYEHAATLDCPHPRETGVSPYHRRVMPVPVPVPMPVPLTLPVPSCAFVYCQCTPALTPHTCLTGGWWSV
jgi:hypothetical protein